MGKTKQTVANSVKVETNRKEEVAMTKTTMTKADALTYLQVTYNDYQAYRKENEKSYHFATKEYMTSFAHSLTAEQLVKLTKVVILLKQFQEMLGKHIFKEMTLNRIYGKENIHYMELSDEEIALINKRRAKAQEFKDVKTADVKTHKAINKALRQQEKEEQEEIAKESE